METLLQNPVAVAASGVILILLTILYRALTNPLRSLPGPWYSTFTRLPLKAAIMSGRRVFHVHALHQKYGAVVRISPDEVAVSDHEGLAQIHRIGGAFRKTEWYHELAAQGEGRYSIFTMTDPKEHAARRRLLARPFSKTFLNQHWHGTVRELTRMAVRRMGEAAKEDGGKVDVMQWWTFMTMDVAGRLMFGHSFDNLERGTVSDFMRVVTTRLIVTGISVELPWIKAIAGVLTLLPVPALRNMFSPNDALYEHGRKFLHSIQASESSSNIFSNIATEAEKGEKLSMDDVHLEASGLIIAGTDTTSTTLTYLTWAVLSRPTLQRDLEQEVSQLPGDYTDTDLEKLPLLNAVIEESLRLYGAAPSGLPRAVPPGGTSIAGHFINAGTTVTTQAYTYHRDASLFPDPDEFLPSRWLHDGISAEAKKAFHPFGAGARTCVGLHLAYMELRLASAEFFRQCKGARLAESATEEAMEMENYFLVVPRGHKCEVLLGA